MTIVFVFGRIRDVESILPIVALTLLLQSLLSPLPSYLVEPLPSLQTEEDLPDVCPSGVDHKSNQRHDDSDGDDRQILDYIMQVKYPRELDNSQAEDGTHE